MRVGFHLNKHMSMYGRMCTGVRQCCKIYFDKINHIGDNNLLLSTCLTWSVFLSIEYEAIFIQCKVESYLKRAIFLSLKYECSVFQEIV